MIYAGKPYRPIYEQAMAAAQAVRGRAVDRKRVLAIGDSVRTDLKGADAFGIDCLFVTAGIHAEEIGWAGEPGCVRARRACSPRPAATRSW